MNEIKLRFLKIKNRIRLRLHAFFSVRCSRMIMKVSKERDKKGLKTGQRCKIGYWFKFCSYWEFKFRKGGGFHGY